MKLRAIYLLGGASLFLGISAPAGLVMAQPAMGVTTASPSSGAPEFPIPAGPLSQGRTVQPLEGGAAPGRVPCPHPILQTLTSTGAPQGGPDFPAAWTGHYASGLNDMRPNRIFAYTFDAKWPAPERACCELVSAVLTLVVKCHGDIPINDAWGILHNGVGIPGAGGAIGWANGCMGQTKTITWAATPAVLAQINAEATDPHLSFAVEDDTAVVSATLQLSDCCVLKHEERPGSM